MSSLHLVAVLATATLSACELSSHPVPGGPQDPLDTPDGDGNDNGDNPAGSDLTSAKQLFDSNVYPVLAAKCSGDACHSQTSSNLLVTRFVATTAKEGWQTATNFTAVVGNHAASIAPVLTKIGLVSHYGIAYTADETANLQAWLDAEVELRNGSANGAGGELSAAAERVRREFVACLQLVDVEAANMPQAFANLTAANNQACSGCHAAGEAGFIANADPGALVTAMTTDPSFLTQYLSVDLTRGSAEAKMIVNRSSVLGVAQGLDPHREHPRFNAANNAGLTALTQLYNATMARVNAVPSVCAP